MNIVGGSSYLYAAYIVVGIIHCGYIGSLIARGKRLQRESDELKRR
jgi:hypothetical protein